MFKMLSIALVAAVALATSANATDAKSILVDNTPIAFNGLGLSDFALDSQLAAYFDLESPSTINGFRWWGSYNRGPDLAPISDTFVVRIFDASNGLPETTPLIEYAEPVIRTVFREGAPGTRTSYQYEMTFPEDFLASGNFALSIVNNTSAVDYWWEINSQCDLCGLFTSLSRNFDSSPWKQSQNSGGLGFTIFGGAVPEPSTLAACGIGIAVSLCWRNRH